jgi:hypothetical protein
MVFYSIGHTLKMGPNILLRSLIPSAFLGKGPTTVGVQVDPRGYDGRWGGGKAVSPPVDIKIDWGNAANNGPLAARTAPETGKEEEKRGVGDAGAKAEARAMMTAFTPTAPDPTSTSS